MKNENHLQPNFEYFIKILDLTKKYSSWYFLKKAVLLNYTRLVTVIVYMIAWCGLAGLSIFMGNTTLAIILCIIVAALIKLYPKFIKKDYPRYTESYPDTLGLYGENDDYLKFLSIKDDLEKQGLLTSMLLNQALKVGEFFEKREEVNNPSKKVFFYFCMFSVLQLVAGFFDCINWSGSHMG